MTGALAVLHRLAVRVERLVDRLRPRRRDGAPVALDPYRGFATPDRLVLRGRVLTSLRRTAPSPEQSRWQNLRQMASLFFTDEVEGVEVEIPDYGVRAVSDEEGYIWIEVPRRDNAPIGWCDVEVAVAQEGGAREAFPVLVPGPDAQLGVISDIDDTLMETGAYSLARNLWTTFTGSTLTRKIFQDSVVLIDHLSGHGRNPVFYVSSSPWNLHAFLLRVFRRAGLVDGPMFLRDLGISETKFVTGTHGGHKGDAIARVMGANPGLPFVLIGDTGQHDAHVYLEACRQQGGRVTAVILREPGPGPDAESRRAIAAMRAMGVTVVTGATFAEVPAALERAGLVV
ncbi:App1 family protein [Tranquillimonas alkanivorans]|uniref:Phosphatidate phosphatase APP1 n=1 Tax=Tranquillimonas alkanivorans TaxID=441119 RepID=A0A1I5U2P1_9RHOB|nr:phosphatase domain-containing protein [Tranquillimonas alkanivorans]SFP89441.1 Phosphatidate phosphatase APP1 [Tranquillimonas alkanivorans]